MKMVRTQYSLLVLSSLCLGLVLYRGISLEDTIKSVNDVISREYPINVRSPAGSGMKAGHDESRAAKDNLTIKLANLRTVDELCQQLNVEYDTFYKDIPPVDVPEPYLKGKCEHYYRMASLERLEMLDILGNGKNIANDSISVTYCAGTTIER